MSERRRIVATAPGRAGIVGNPSDIYGGSVVSCAVPRRATCRITALDAEGCGVVAEIHLGQASTTIRGVGDLQLQGDEFDLARCVLADLGLPVLPCRITLETTVPYCAGLSGSTALLVALTAALLLWQGDDMPHRYLLAERVRRIEYERLGVTCGFQDAYMTVFGGLRYCDFRGKHVAAPGEHFGTVEALGDVVPMPPLVIAHTDVSRVSGSVHRPLSERWLEGDRVVVEAYRRVAQLGRLGKRALLARDWATLGRLMNDNHAEQRDLGGSGAENEILIAAALDSGAWGAKLAGAGRGGTIIALHPDPPRLIEILQGRGVREVFMPDAAAAGVTWEIDQDH